MKPHGPGRALWAMIAGLVIFSLAQSVVRAADPAEVEDLIRRGVEFRRGGNDNKALPLFKKAYDLAPIPRTAAQLGLVEMALGYRLDAERHLREGLESPRDFWIQKNRLTLESALQTVKAAIGEIAIQGTPAGAEVWLNGTQIGRLPLKQPVRMGEGPSTIEVRASGHVTETRSVMVTGAKREEVSVHLRRTEIASPVRPAEPPHPAEDETAATAEPDAVPAAQESGRGSPPESSGSNHGTLRTLAWVAAAAAVVGVGVGVLETVAWRDKQNQFEGVTKPSLADPSMSVPACGADEVGRGSPAICGTLYDDLKRAQTFAIVAYAAGGALAIGATVLFLMSKGTDESVPQHSVACAPVGGALLGGALLGGSMGAACRISF